MRRISTLLAAGAVLATLLAPALPRADDPISVAFVKDSELYVGTAEGNARQVTSDHLAKGLPTWSPDGTMIAFIEKTDPDVALARLVVVTAKGQQVASAPINKHDPNTVDVGMRYVEAVRWATANQIAVSGSADPSTSQYLVFDLATSTVRRAFYADGAADFARDGRAAYRGLEPHFAAAEQRRPSLFVDDRKIYPTGPAGRAIQAGPVWSPEGDRIAAVIAADDGHQALLVWRAGKASELALPGIFPDRGGEDLEWAPSGEIYLFQAGLSDKAWRIDPATDGHVQVGTGDLPSTKAKALRARLTAIATARGEHEPSFWCERCALDVEPFASPAERADR